MKKEENLKAAILIAIIIAVVSITPIASASDWEQFQKNNINSGYTADSAPVSDPELAWSNHTSGTGMGGIDVTPIIANGAVYVLDYQGILWSFDAATGIENWNTDLTEGSGTFELSTPAYNDGIVYAALSSGSESAGSGRVCAVYANGTIRECEYYGLENYQLNTPITYADGKIYLGNSKYGTKDISTYYCIDASDVSNEIWSRTAPYATGYYFAGAAIIGDYIVYGDDSSIVTCLYKDNGTFVDSIDVSTTYGINANEIRSSIVWNDGYDRIYFSSQGGYVFAIGFDQISGQFDTNSDWNTPCTIGYSTSTPVVYDGRVYVGYGGFGPTGKLYCLSESDGTQEWVTNNLGGVQSSPALSVAGSRKLVYFTVNNANGSAYCIEDLGNGNYNIVWEWNPPEPDNQYIMQGMAISDGFVYFGTDYGRVYALKEGQEQFEIPIYKNNTDPKNLFSILLNSSDTTLVEVIGDDAANGDKVFRYVNGEGPKSATYFNGVWYGASDVEPIKLGVGYEYDRWGGDAFNITNLGQLPDSMNTTIYGELSTGDPKNLIGYASFNVTDLSSAFNGHPVNGDKVYRYVNGEGPKSATYFNGVWYGASDVNPIEPGIGYEYGRVGATFHWTYNP